MMEMPQATRKKLETGIAAYKRGMVSYDYVQATLDEFAESCARMAREEEREKLRALVLDDAWSLTFQTFGQYRTALAAAIRKG